VLGAGTRASLVADGTGRVRVQTGDAARDRRLERMAVEAALDLELLADGRPPNATVADVLGEALARAIGSDARAFS
jgi:hypothetical protein